MRSKIHGGLSIEILLFLLLFLTYGYFFQGGQHNENSRFDQVRSVVESGSLAIDRFSYNTADQIEVGGHKFPNKPPATTFVGVPLWIVFGAFLSMCGLSVALWEHFVCYFTSWFSIGLVSAISSIVLYRLILRRTNSTQVALFLSITYGLGTIAFPFSTMFFGHQLGAGAVLGAFAILYLMDDARGGVQQSLRGLVAGLLLGFSLCVEYTNVFALIPILLYGLTRWGGRSLLPVMVGITLGSVPHLTYNWLISGDPFFLTHAAYQGTKSGPLAMHATGFLGEGLPSWAGLIGILFAPQRGLFYCNPWLLLVIPALAVQAVRKEIRGVDVACLSIWLSFVVFNAGFGESVYYWGGGNSVGPRYIIASLPFLVFVISPLLLYRRVWFLFLPVALISIAIMLMATAVEPRASLDFSNPVLGLYWPFYQQGRLALATSGVFSDLLITRDSVAFNWGKLIGLSGAYQLWPLLMFWLFMFYHLLVRVGFNRRVFFCTGGFLVAFGLVPVIHLNSYTEVSEGLTGRYLRGAVWGSTPSAAPLDPSILSKTELVQVDPIVNFDWTTSGRPVIGHFSVEWRGTISIEGKGEYVFATESDDGSALFIDGALIVDNWGEHGRQRRSGVIYLVPGEYPILVRYYDKGFGSTMQLLWGFDGGEMEVVPQKALTPQRR